jgi:hypothetical protein
MPWMPEITVWKHVQEDFQSIAQMLRVRSPDERGTGAPVFSVHFLGTPILRNV